MLRTARTAYQLTGLNRLCMAGGVALNCVGNGRIVREGPFDESGIQPAAGDAGGALGVALSLAHQYAGVPRVSAERAGTWQPKTTQRCSVPPFADAMRGTLLGPSFSDEEIAGWLDQQGYPAERVRREDL